MMITRKQSEYIKAREQDIDMAFEASDTSYLNQYPEDYNGEYDPPKKASNNKKENITNGR